MNRYELVYTPPVLIHYTKYVFDKVVIQLSVGEYLIKKIICADRDHIYNVNFITSFGNIVNVNLHYEKSFNEEKYFNVPQQPTIKFINFKRDYPNCLKGSCIPLTESQIQLIAEYYFNEGDWKFIQKQLKELFELN